VFAATLPNDSPRQRELKKIARHSTHARAVTQSVGEFLWRARSALEELDQALEARGAFVRRRLATAH
jgi:hypothetical protein